VLAPAALSSAAGAPQPVTAVPAGDLEEERTSGSRWRGKHARPPRSSFSAAGEVHARGRDRGKDVPEADPSRCGRGGLCLSRRRDEDADSPSSNCARKASWSSLFKPSLQIERR
jgi:hypothetical protein